jgi:diguanylate cyclase (GGDEF)-like protein
VSGDRILCELGRLLTDTTRGGDVACRYGGDEFIVFLPGCSSKEAQRRAEELCKHVEALSVSHRGRQLARFTISIGTATYPRHGATAIHLLRVADRALYRAKAAGRNRVIAA